MSLCEPSETCSGSLNRRTLERQHQRSMRRGPIAWWTACPLGGCRTARSVWLNTILPAGVEAAKEHSWKAIRATLT